jgi:hypothetical protein
MIAQQLSIFAENKPGRLASVTAVLAREAINIRATTISTSDTFGVISLIVDDPKRAEAALTGAGMMVSLRNVLAILIPDQPGGLDKLTQLLAAERVNVNNAYGFVLENGRQAVFVVDVDQIERAEGIIEKHGFRTLDTVALTAMAPSNRL